MTFALGKDRDEHVRAGHLFAAGRLHMDDRPLDDALEPGRRLGVLVTVGDQVVELGIDIFGEIALELIHVDVARPHHGDRVPVVDQGQEQMFERRVFVAALVGEREGAVERLL